MKKILNVLEIGRNTENRTFLANVCANVETLRATYLQRGLIFKSLNLKFLNLFVIMIISTNSFAQGDIIWKKNYGGVHHDHCYSVTEVTGGIVVVGNSHQNSFGSGDFEQLTGKGDYDATIVKYGNTGVLEWVQNFGGSGSDAFVSAAETSDGGIVAVGFSAPESFGNGDWLGIGGKGGHDAIIVKFDATGNWLWRKNFGGSGTDDFNAVIAVSDGIIVVGSSEGSSFGNGDWAGIDGKGSYDAIIVKFSNDGEMVWKKPFGGWSDDQFWDVTAVSDGVIAVGASQGNSFGNGDWDEYENKGWRDAIVVKFNFDGGVVWKNNFGGINEDIFSAVTLTSDGIVAVGRANSSTFNTGDWNGIEGKGGQDAIIAKFNNSGVLQWNNNFGGSDYEYFTSVTAISDGVVAVGTSSTNSFGNGDWEGIEGKGNQDAIIVKFDNSGNVVWKRPVGGNNHDEYQSVITVSDGIIAAGSAADKGWGNTDWEGLVWNGNYEVVIVKHALDGYHYPVTDIVNVPETATIGAPLTLTGTVVPSYANNQTIEWSVKNSGGTGASITDGNIFNATAEGTATITAKIINGTAAGVHYEKDFDILVSAEFVSVTDITGLPSAATVFVPLTLTGAVQPDNATYSEIIWILDDAGTTGATLAGNIFTANGNGVAGLWAVVENGLAMGEDYEQYFEITVSGYVSVTDIINGPTACTVGIPYTLTGTVIPNNATYRTIVWSLNPESVSDATLTGNVLVATSGNNVKVTATVENGIAFEDDFEKEFEITVVLSIEPAASLQSLRVFPNPTQGELRITGFRHSVLDTESPANIEGIAEMLNLIQYRNDIQGVQIFDITGRVVFTSSLSLLSPETALDITHLPAGVYFVKVGNETVKVVKK